MGIIANWTSSLVCKLAEKRFGVVFSNRGMRNLFDRVGLSYTRLTYALEKADTEKQEQFRKNFEILKKLLNNDITRTLFKDESIIRDYQAIMKTQFLKGKQHIILTFGKHKGVKLAGCLDYETDHIYVKEHQQSDAEVFLHFLENVLKQYPDEKTGMILDNARIHHAKLLKSFLEENRKRLELVFLPPYSPNLNKIEELCDWMKDSVINNVFFHSCWEIRTAVTEICQLGKYDSAKSSRLSVFISNN